MSLALREKMGEFAELRDLLERAIIDTPPVLVRDGGVIARLYHGHQPLVLRHFLLAEVLLQDNQVAAHRKISLRRSKIKKQIIFWQ